MKHARTVLLVLICSLATVGSAAAAPREPLKVVLWLGGFAHEFRSVGGILSEALPRARPMKITLAWDGEFLDAPQRPDVILMYHCHESTKDILTEAQQGKLLAWVKEGVGVVALHASYYSFVEWDEYHKFYGARFIQHGKSEARLRVTPVQKEHPIFKGLDEPLEVVSELYQSTPVPEDCDLLARSQEIGQGEPQPSIWTRTYGQGRIVTILPGHFADNFKQAPFQQLILNSMDWVTEESATQQDDADASAQPVTPRYTWEQAAIEAFTLPEGFEISLVAAEPHLANPISMALDEQGRIYVANAHSYRQKWWLMNPPPEQKPANPIVCLTLGPDGRAVEATLVAEGFEHPVMGLAIRGHRLWASNLNRVFVTALDEQGRMTGPREDLVRDAATPWNPFGMYRLVRGPDDQLYLTIGDHPTQLTGVSGKSAVRLDSNGSGAVFRFRDDGADLQLLIEGMRAPFALGFTPFGKLWVLTNGEGSPNCLLDAVRGTDYRFRNQGPNDWSWLTGAQPLAAPVWENPPGAHTAVLPYYSSNFPEPYWGNLFVSNFGVHGEPAKKNEVLRLALDDRGQVVGRAPFISSSDPKFRPTEVSLAPDGSLFMLDWYGKDDENDLTGRLYRIRYTGEHAARNSGSGLASRNHAERAQAQATLLAAGPASSLPVIDEVLSGKDALAAAEALWVLRRSSWESAPDHIRKACAHDDWRVRRLAIQLLREMGKQDAENLRKLLEDLDAAVRLEAALGFRDPHARCEALIQALRGGAAKIRRLRFTAALEIARFGQEEHFATLLADDDSDMRLAGLIALDEAFYESSKGFKTPSAELAQNTNESPAEGVAPALTARKVLARFIAEPGALEPAALLELARRWPHASLQNAVEEIVQTRLTAAEVTPSEFAHGLDALVRLELPTNHAEILAARSRLLDGAIENSALTKEISQASEKLALLEVLAVGDARTEDLRLLKRFMLDENADVRAKAGSLIGARHVGDATAVTFCRDLASNESASLGQRLDSLVTLTKLEKTPDRGNWEPLLLSSRQEVVLAALRGLQNGADRAAALHLIENAAERVRNQHGAAVQEDLAFTIAVLSGRTVAGADKTTLRGQALESGSAGSPELGRFVFQTRGCYACHVTGDPKVRAPQLDHVAATHDAAYLIDSILDPNQSVKTGFLTQEIVLPNGKIVTGTLHRNVSGDGRYDEVVDSEGRSTLYPSGQIEEPRAISAMPAGLEATMSASELIDLIAYLKTLK
jgi:putative heme-binding domain-containing protein